MFGVAPYIEFVAVDVVLDNGAPGVAGFPAAPGATGGAAAAGVAVGVGAAAAAAVTDVGAPGSAALTAGEAALAPPGAAPPAVSHGLGGEGRACVAIEVSPRSPSREGHHLLKSPSRRPWIDRARIYAYHIVIIYVAMQ